MIVCKLSLFSAFQIADLPASAVQLISRRITAAVFGVPCVGGQKPLAADPAFFRSVTDTQALKEIRPEHPYKGYIVHPLDQLRHILAGTDGRYILSGADSGYGHPGISLCNRKVRREIAAKHFCEALCGAVSFVSV